MGSSDPRFQRWGTASELGDFAYCRRAWWWKRHPESLPAGAHYSPPEAAYARGLQVHAQLEAAHVAPQVASRAGYAAALLFALGVALALALWLGWL